MTVSEEKLNAVKRCLRAGMTVRDAAKETGVSTGTVARTKKKMGLGRDVITPRSRLPQPTQISPPNMKGGRPPNTSGLGTNYNPSAAALRLAVFDPIVARALARSAEEDEDGE